MQMICINNQEGYCKLTVGKSYEIIDAEEGYYQVINNESKLQKYQKNKFMSKEEINLIANKQTNPSNYYEPAVVKFSLVNNDVSMQVISMDERLREVGDLFDFIDKINVIDLELTSKYGPDLTKDSVYLRGKKHLWIIL